MAQTATLHTNHGDIVIDLFADQAPKTVDNFVGLANYITVFTEPFMLVTFRNNVLWIVFGASFTIIFGLLVAALADPVEAAGVYADLLAYRGQLGGGGSGSSSQMSQMVSSMMVRVRVSEMMRARRSRPAAGRLSPVGLWLSTIR